MMPTYTKRLIDAKCLDWFKDTLEYKEWKAMEDWKKENPIYDHKVTMAIKNKSRDQLTKIFGNRSKNPKFKFGHISKKVK